MASVATGAVRRDAINLGTEAAATRLPIPRDEWPRFAQARSHGCSKRESFRYRHGATIYRRYMRRPRAFDRPAESNGKYVEFSRTGKHIV
uniref:hypothetical protein n=1 Tax=Burkholderia sp. AU33423 TaxID=2015355 RepID=UPI00117ED2D8|nr:hypothetical protein [Burkholderia sp. AU33423]